MRFRSIVLGALLAWLAVLPVGAQSTPPASAPRPMPPVPAGSMPDRAMPRLSPSAPMATPPMASPPSELTPPSERTPVTPIDSGRSSSEPDPVRPGAR